MLKYNACKLAASKTAIILILSGCSNSGDIDPETLATEKFKENKEVIFSQGTELAKEAPSPAEEIEGVF